MQIVNQTQYINFYNNSSDISAKIGNEVFEKLEKVEFQQEWDTLYKKCPWATVFQSRSFIATWYKLYQNKHCPILITKFKENKLQGIMALAVLNTSRVNLGHDKSIRIVGAGHLDAEYHTWITEEKDSDEFMTAVLYELKKHFAQYELRLRYIPSQAPLNWIKKDKQWKSQCVVQSIKRPLMNLSDPKLDALFRKSNYRLKTNRLKRSGRLRMEHVVDQEQFSSILNDLVTLYDFRRGARFNKFNFKNDPLKAPLLQEMFKHNLLHVTVLKVNEQVVSAIIAVAGKEWVHLSGINTHIPFNAKFYSPGYVHIRMLGQLLSQESFSVFDITPGGDSYKEELANHHDQVHELLISNNFTSRIKRKIRIWVHTRLINAGIWPMGLEVELKKRVYFFLWRFKIAKNVGPFKSLIHLVRNIITTDQKVTFELKIVPDEKPSSLSMNKNNLQDLLAFEAKGTLMSRWEFLQDAMHRYEIGEQSYTWCEDGRLLGCVWLREAAAFEAGNPNTPEEVNEKVLLQGFYCHPQGYAKFPSFLIAIAAAASGDQQQRLRVHALVSSKDKITCQCLQAAGFQPLAG